MKVIKLITLIFLCVMAGEKVSAQETNPAVEQLVSKCIASLQKHNYKSFRKLFPTSAEMIVLDATYIRHEGENIHTKIYQNLLTNKLETGIKEMFTTLTDTDRSNLDWVNTDYRNMVLKNIDDQQKVEGHPYIVYTGYVFLYNRLTKKNWMMEFSDVIETNHKPWGIALRYPKETSTITAYETASHESNAVDSAVAASDTAITVTGVPDSVVTYQSGIMDSAIAVSEQSPETNQKFSGKLGKTPISLTWQQYYLGGERYDITVYNLDKWTETNLTVLTLKEPSENVYLLGEPGSKGQYHAYWRIHKTNNTITGTWSTPDGKKNYTVLLKLDTPDKYKTGKFSKEK